MGNAYAKNTLDDTIDELNESIFTASQGCKSTLQQLEQLNISHVNNTVFKGINLNEVGTISMSCMASSTTQNNIQASMNTQIQQIAKTVNQSLNLSGSTEADNNTKLLTQLKDVVYNSFVQDCSAAITQSEIVTLTDDSGDTFGIINFSESGSNVLSCTQKNQAVSDMKTQITQQISQTATATVQSFLAQIFLILLMVVIIIGMIEFGSIVKIIVIIVILVGLYFLLAWIFGWAPFRRTPPNVNVSAVSQGGIQPGATPPHLPSGMTAYVKGGLPTISASIVSGLAPADFARFELIDLAQGGVVIEQSTQNPATFDPNTATLNPGRHNLIVRAVDKKNRTYQAPLLAWYVVPPYFITITGPDQTIPGTPVSIPACPSTSKISPYIASNVVISGMVQASTSGAPSPAGGVINIAFSSNTATPNCAPGVADLTNIPVAADGTFSVTATDIHRTGNVYSGAYTFSASFIPPNAPTGSGPVVTSEPYSFTVCTGSCAAPAS